ncbi:MAG: rhodanese-like domain-containing protein [Alphaproteobacteria bacterium]|nr:rhodanese-like domain-containing protein [Alphaproteobacteria bacterium]
MGRLFGVIAALLVVGACTIAGDETGILAADAARAHERGEILLVDVRSGPERLSGMPRGAVHKQFGPDTWTGTVSTAEAAALVDAIRDLSEARKPVVFLCQSGIRSARAANEMKVQGLAALTVTDGYLGNVHGPGWKIRE